MTRTDDDSWDITESVGATALGVAMARAAETLSARPLFVDRFAQWFIDAAITAGWQPSFSVSATDVPDADPALVEQLQRRVQSIWGYAAARTKHFDDFFTSAGAAGIRQVVILAAGLDARAWRLPWVTDTIVYEIDQPKVLEFKADTLRAHNARAVANDIAVPIDLRQDWPIALRAAGFDTSQPTAWLAEGLLPYLPSAGQDLLFERVQQLSAPDSRIAVEAFGNEYFDEEKIQERRAKMQEVRNAAAKAGRQTTDVSELFFNEPHADVADWLRDHGWEVGSTTSAELLARHKRVPASDIPDAGSVFVEGLRLTGP
ncbi:SAM-dependent methyltransferase [Mycolicibacterium hodleri]|uniref:S-adenosyl-L-methionine-dependent methyltransferase n=1 Tax=Mycolicibacterium hodleri TaxID=49897 RepID=A0A502E1A4_9MYCO|nr:SAM-dependent methyltransferase [Mycolicibacterium hodleri]TPG31568.1 SAM-dependent methyltransferase [Mycolicibacterium hodleri]